MTVNPINQTYTEVLNEMKHMWIIWGVIIIIVLMILLIGLFITCRYYCKAKFELSRYKLEAPNIKIETPKISDPNINVPISTVREVISKNIESN